MDDLRSYEAERIEKLKETMILEHSLRDKDGISGRTQVLLASMYNPKLELDKLEKLFYQGVITKSWGYKEIDSVNGCFWLWDYLIQTINKPLTVDLIKDFHKEWRSLSYDYKVKRIPIGHYDRRTKDRLSRDFGLELNELLQGSYYKDLDGIIEFFKGFCKICPFAEKDSSMIGVFLVFRQCLLNGVTPPILYSQEAEEIVKFEDDDLVDAYFLKGQAEYQILMHDYQL